MAERTRSVPKSAEDILRITDRTLGSVIESVLGRPPSLDVLKQWRMLTPRPPWVSHLENASAVLVRCTGYRVNGTRLSRNLSYVDVSGVDAALLARLEAGEVNLGQLFVSDEIRKLDFVFGTEGESIALDDEFLRHFAGDGDDLQPFVWRRYAASLDDEVCFVVIESLPIRTWQSLLGSDDARMELLGDRA
jgi:hypothetical protein